MWGANAVNGVINILTKKADETQGTMISFTGGSQERILGARHGGKINGRTSFRLFARGKHVENFNTTPQHQEHVHDSGGALQHQANDEWRNFATGFRVDGDLDSRNQWMLQGGYGVGTANQLAITEFVTRNNAMKDKIDNQTGNILFRWDNQQSENNKWRFQAYYDYFKRHSLGVTNEVNTLDLEIQSCCRLGSRLSRCF